MFRLIMGAIAGGLAIWLFGDEVRRYATNGTREVRKRAADTLQVVESKASEVLDSAKEQVHSTFQAGQDVVRPKAF
jgi:hypothetical protein